MPLSTFIFDLDGTLLDSIADLADAINRMLAEHHYPTQPMEVFPLYIGDGVRALVERALPPEALARGELDARVADYQRHYADTWNLQSKPYEGMLDALHQMHAQGHAIGVLSNKPQAFTTLCCDHFFPGIPFFEVRGARDDVPRKPDPAAALDMLASLGVAPEDAAYIGDSGIDMEMATRAAMIPIGVRWGFRDEAELLANGAKILIDHPRDLLNPSLLSG
ncbi:HAD family hydrolase [Phragmitibacter flavus]|uniref:phosphoglycolate phosphatase n=1 Tax=Phragmitibacter flavus TaxID=2576071 RepID=A0A5R8KCC8_9BACT|nr:HAD family hydrolase [Phragmitibacter flavus]TLD69960.1 HAD family hydrolase [Phragmitibacter flavus]